MNESRMLVSESGPRRIFFAGTDTEVGKTFVAALFAKAYRNSGVNVGVYKPVASGCVDQNGDLIAEDAVRLWRAAGEPRSPQDVCPQRFLAALAPSEAARVEGRTVDRQLLRSGARCWEKEHELLIIEGAGGLFSPLADGFLNIDLVRQLEPTKLVLVAANRLGVIHQTLATCAAAKQHGKTVDAILLSNLSAAGDASSETNGQQIARYSDVPVLGSIHHGATTLPSSLSEALFKP
jgi:dethiobiotin synthetase